MKWDMLLPLLITTGVGLVGWFVVHLLSSRRDQANKRRELRVQHLLEAYQNLMNAACYQKLEGQEEVLRLVTKASADIQLFGNEKQIQMACQCTRDYAAGNASITELLENLRSDLRKELNLPVTQEKLQWLRAARRKQVQNGNNSLERDKNT
jgi:hypothetical protein